MTHRYSNKVQKDLNQNDNLKMFRITVDSFVAIKRQILNLTCFLIGVLCVSSTTCGFNK